MRRFFRIAIPVAIVLFLAAVFIPNLMTAMERSKQKRTMADIRTIATAIEAYETDHPDGKGSPINGPSAKLVSLLQPTYIKQLPLIDGWRRPFGSRRQSMRKPSVRGADRGQGSCVTGGAALRHRGERTSSGCWRN